MGAKHWTTGRVKTSRYGGRYVATYPNTPGGVFQDGSGYEFTEPTFADEPDSLDCGTATVTVNVTQQADPYADANSQVKDNGIVVPPDIYDTNSHTYSIYAGDTFHVEGLCVDLSTGINPNLHMDVTKNTVEVFSDDTPCVPGASLNYSDVVADGDNYIVNVVATADAPESPVACGDAASYSGGEAFPTEVFVSLGSSFGNVTLNFDALSIPDKFEVWYNGLKVIDTGYRGDSSYQSSLDAELATRGLPPETIMGLGSGTATFSKTSTTTSALVRVYAPLSGTAWNFTLNCPVPF